MKKIVIVALLFCIGNFAFAQKLVTRKGAIKFEASMPAFEEIAAKTDAASSILDGTSGDFAALMLLKSFKFKAPLMEEHFNENYVESSKFPKATFKGKIANFNVSKLTATKTVYDLEGDLTLHGVTKRVKTKVTLSKVSGKVILVSEFLIKPQDYKIEIPNVVKNKIADNVKIDVNFSLEDNQ